MVWLEMLANKPKITDNTFLLLMLYAFFTLIGVGYPEADPLFFVTCHAGVVQ